MSLKKKMAELGVNREEGNEVVVVVEDEEAEEERENGNGSEVVQWERLLPRTELRVLLVEADDSTRQIIAALLRKCNYKVAATSDGLKAWEILKRRHNNIDLILTELDLPSISGYALLTLIMEHDGCKNIPVIVMSSQDSITMVLKCMLKGAVDFLIKPVRKNELKNLWRHVWRRFSTNVRNPQSLTAGQCKVEATFENQPASHHSSDNVSTSRKISKISEKATDTQSSCTTPYLETPNALMETMQNLSHIKHREETEHHSKNIKLDKELPLDGSDTEQKATRLASEGDQPHNEANVSSALRVEDESFSGLATEDGLLGPEYRKHRATATSNVDVHELPEPSGEEAKDLIGRINKQKCTMRQSSSNGELDSIYSTPGLELSLRRSHDTEIKEMDERNILNHSRASAFSSYSSNKKPRTTTSVDDHMMEIKAVPDTPAWSKTIISSGEIKPDVVVSQSAHGEAVSPGPQTGYTGPPGIMFDGGVWTGYGPMLQPVFSPPLTFPTGRSPKSAFHREESPFLTSTSLGEATHHSFGQVGNEVKDTESVERSGYINIPALNLSGSSNPFNDSDTQHKSSAYGSVSEVTDANATASDMIGTIAIEESVGDDGGKGNTFDHDQYRPRTGHHSSEREAALAKFRLKRKGRCYEKKVRYQSRKRLAEERPRVKGQFVRHAPNDKDAC